MMRDERISSFIESLNEDERPELSAVEREARENHIPIIRPEIKNLLKVLLAMKKPETILEIGTAVGFSAAFLAEYQPKGGTVTTIEKSEPRIAEAEKNFARTGVDDRVTLLSGDAAEILPTLDGPYDMIFMDAAKGQYLNFLPDALRLLGEEGILLSDNVFQDGDVLESRYGIIRRNRTIHSRMRDYLYTLTHHSQLVTSVIPIGDGLALSIKRTKEKD